MKKFSLISLLAIGVSGVAHASGSLGVANGFNAFVFGNATFTGGETEGAVATGGNVTVNNSANFTVQSGNGATVGTYSNIGLYVAGSIIDNSNGNVNNGTNILVAGSISNLSPNSNSSYIYYGGTASGLTNFTNNAHGHLINQNLVQSSVFTAQQSFSDSQTALIAGLTANLTLTSSLVSSNTNSVYVNGVKDDGGNNLTIDASHFANGNKPIVVTIDQSAIANDQNLDLHIANQGTSTVLFNIVDDNSSKTVDWNWKTDDVQSYTLFNFATQTTVKNTGDYWNGTVLSPYADVQESRAIQGNVIANTLENEQSSETHFGSNGAYEFKGVAPQAVPEPAPMAVLGMGVLVVLRRRKKA